MVRWCKQRPDTQSAKKTKKYAKRAKLNANSGQTKESIRSPPWKNCHSNASVTKRPRKYTMMQYIATYGMCHIKSGRCVLCARHSTISLVQQESNFPHCLRMSCGKRWLCHRSPQMSKLFYCPQRSVIGSKLYYLDVIQRYTVSPFILDVMMASIVKDNRKNYGISSVLRLKLL